MATQLLSLQEISDRIQIQDLLVRYALAIDTKNWSLLDTCFAPDAEIDYTSTGGMKGRYPEVRKWLEQVLSPFAVTMHSLSNSSLELDGDRAYARTYLWNPMGFGPSKESLRWFTVSAHYVDELVCTDAGWRIQTRLLEGGAIVGGLPGQS